MTLPRLILRGSKVFNSKLFNNLRVTQNSNFKLFSTSKYLAADRRYSKQHEWVELNGKIGTIGISNYAQEKLGDVVFAQLPDVGTTLQQYDECGALESVKSASEIYTPVSGKIIEANRQVESTPSLINSSCYEKGWLFKVEVTDEQELSNLMDENQYQEFLKTEEH